MDSRIKSAIAVGQTYQLQQLIQGGVDTNARDGNSNTPLILASKQGCLPIMQLLHRGRGKMDATDKHGRGPIHYACIGGYIDMVQYMLGCLDKALCDTADSSGHTPLMLAAEAGHQDICKLLVKHVQADVNSVNSKRQTALHLATLGGHTLVARLLLRGGATADRRNGHDVGHCLWETSLMYAARDGRHDIVKLLIHAGADPTKLNKQGQAAITFAAQNGHLDIVKELHHCSASTNSSHKHTGVLTTLGDSPLVAAATYGQTDIVDYLLKSNVTRHLHVAVVDATRAGRTDVVKLIIAHLPSLVFHQSDEVIFIPKLHQDIFYLAVAHNHMDIVQYLLHCTQVDINGWTAMGLTALHEAVRKGHTSLVQLLIDSGARTNSHDKVQNLTPLQAACVLGHTDIVQILTSAYAPGTPQHTNIIHVVDTQDNTCLHFAIMKNHHNVVTLLLEAGIEPCVQNSKYQTPLHLAVYLDSWHIVRILLEAVGDERRVGDRRWVGDRIIEPGYHRLGEECSDNWLGSDSASTVCTHHDPSPCSQVTPWSRDTLAWSHTKCMWTSWALQIPDREGNTPLLVGVWKNYLDMTWYILDQPGTTSPMVLYNFVKSCSALQVAANLGKERMCNLLLEHGLPQSDLQRTLLEDVNKKSLSEVNRQMLTRLVLEPISLACQCVRAIRASIHCHTKSKAVHHLPLPSRLRRQITLLDYCVASDEL